MWSKRDGKKIKESFPTEGQAKAWRASTMSAVNKGTMRAPTADTLGIAAEAWLVGVEDGTIRNRSGDRYKPSVIRSYRAALNNRILKDLGAHRLSEIRTVDLQDLVDRLVADGLDASTIRNQLMPVRAIYSRALLRGDVSVNPTRGLKLPAVRGRRDRIATPSEAERLLEALPADDRALWATALYAGLRRGELMGLRWEDIDFNAGVLRVERAFDPVAGVFVEPKSKAGNRRVPIASVLRTFLLQHRLRGGRATGLVFGRSASLPFNDRTMQLRAQRAWKKAKLAAIGLHESRHTFASLMIDAGVNAKALSTYLGHSSVVITLDRYGHLMPGNEEEAAQRLDEYLARNTPGPTTGPQAVETASLSGR